MQVIGVPRSYLAMGTQAVHGGGPVYGIRRETLELLPKYFRKQRFYGQCILIFLSIELSTQGASPHLEASVSLIRFFSHTARMPDPIIPIFTSGILG